MRKLIAKLQREDYYIFLIFLLLGFSIIAKSYYSKCGYLSPDSINYLELAKNLTKGNGFYGQYNWRIKDDTFFSIWPIGYPYIIFVFSKITGLSVFWASKTLNIFLIGLILICFRFLFKSSAYLFGFILLFASFLEIYSYTWSESLFIFGLVWFATSLYLFIKSEKVLIISISILLSSLSLFLSRYIGAFSFGLIGLLGIYYRLIKRNKYKFFILIFIVILNITIMSLYLYNNYLETGFIGGAFRRPSTASHLKIFKNLMKALFSDSIIPFNNILISSKLFFLFQYSIISYIILKYRKNILRPSKSIKSEELNLPFIFGIIGFTYIFFIILFRWNLKFNWYGFRLLGPGSFMIFITIFLLIKNYTTAIFFSKFKKIWIAFAVISWLINVPFYLLTQNDKDNCDVTIQSAKKRYSKQENYNIN